MSSESKQDTRFGPRIDLSPNKFPQKQPAKHVFSMQASFYHTRNALYNSDYLAIPSCTICLEPFQSDAKDKRPLCLPYCGHTLCQACLKQLISSSPESITCHICKRVNSLYAHRTLDSFPLSWAIIDTIRNAAPAEAVEVHTQPSCSHCEYREASHWCVHHGVKLCAYCAFAHAKECRPGKLAELASVKDYFKSIHELHKKVMSEIRERIDKATKAKEAFLMEVVPKLNQLVIAIDEIKLSTIKNFDFFVLQLEELEKKVVKHAINEQDLLKVDEERIMKQHIKYASELEDMLKRYADHQLSSYSINILFDNKIFESIRCLIDKMFKAEILSPYLPEPASATSDALFTACENSDIAAADFLLTIFQEDPNKRDNVGMTPFCIGVKNRWVELYRKLFESYKADPNVADNVGKSPLIYACMNNDEEGVKYLVRKCKVNTNFYTKWHDTPLHCAAEVGNLNIIKVLVNEGRADASVVNERGKTPREVASDQQAKQFLASNFHPFKKPL